jgi:hypothetical protein
VPADALTPLQLQATRLFFSLPARAGFAVAGGAALLAQGIIHRPTRDADLFLLDTATSEVSTAALTGLRAVSVGSCPPDHRT